MRSLASTMLVLLILAAALALVAEAQETETKPETQRELVIPDAARRPKPAHAQEPFSDWPYPDDPQVPEGYQLLHLLRQFSFASGSSELDREARGGMINTAQEKMSRNRDWRFLIVGRPDPVGEGEPDHDLARTRAQTAFDFLTAQGVDPKRMSIVMVAEPRLDIDPDYPLWTPQGGTVEIWACGKKAAGNSSGG